MKIQVKTEGLEGDALKFAQNLNETLADMPVGITKDEMDAAIEKFKTDNPAPTPEISKAAFDELTEKVNQIVEAGKGGAEKTVTMYEAVKENKEALQKMMKNQGPEVTIKATTARASITTNPNQYLLPGVGQLIRVARAFYDVCRKVNLPMGSHNGTIKYLDWDEDTTVKAAAAVAEGAAFPESTATFKGFSLDLKKIGDTLPVNEEFFEDEVNAAAELEMFLENNVESVKDYQILRGDGTGENLTGALASVSAYSAAASGIQDANIYDLYIKVKGAITSAGGNKYNPNIMVMNNTTINRLLLKKDQNDNYQFPPSHPIFNNVVEDNNMADNTALIGDSRFATIYEMGGVSLSRGYVSAQFKADQITLKARQRMLFLIKNSDKSGFRKVTDITAALATLQSTP